MASTASASVTQWIGQLKEGDEAALRQLHARYWPSLVARAQKRLKGTPVRAADAEDVAQDAFWSFYCRFRAGQLPRLVNRHDLLALLTHIVACKAANQIEHELGTQKRGGGRVHDESSLESLVGEDVGRPLEQASDPRLLPEEEAILSDCYRRYVGGLPDNLRDFAELYLANYTHREIAEHLGCSERTVDRKIALILRKWQEMGADDVRGTLVC
ncbi:MAG: helix-turn-helix domain-containing protein [Planctomycetia bacterium]|nr:helix-turn-helix domain-containing protein [Planctomycetia bacterium]